MCSAHVYYFVYYFCSDLWCHNSPLHTIFSCLTNWVHVIRILISSWWRIDLFMWRRLAESYKSATCDGKPHTRNGPAPHTCWSVPGPLSYKNLHCRIFSYNRRSVRVFPWVPVLSPDNLNPQDGNGGRRISSGVPDGCCHHDDGDWYCVRYVRQSSQYEF